MKKILALVLAFTFVLTLAACGQAEPQSPDVSETTVAPESTEATTETASVLAGTYKYYEDKGTMGVMPWTIEIGEDGSCVLTEHNSYIGDQVKVCDGWVDNGDGTFTSGAWESTDGPKPDFIDEVGRITWQVVGDGICQPVNGPASADPSLVEEATEATEATEEEEELNIVTPENYVPDMAVAVFATDRHDNPTILPKLLSAIYSNGYSPALVALGGDVVGSKGDFFPVVDTEVIRAEVDISLSPDVRLDILCASHDENMTDGANVLHRVNEGFSRGEFYVYILPEAYMDNEEAATTASAEFISWAQSAEVDASKPLIVLSHMPMHYLRKDNLGAAIWHEAINQVATAGGSEPIRNVFFFHGHNHTADSTEYIYEPGSSVAIHGFGEDGQSEDTIFYTYITAGYLNENGTCTLLKVEEGNILVLKCSLEGLQELAQIQRLPG